MLHKCLSLVLMCSVGLVYSETFQTCLQKDSISCLQIQMYKLAKSYFDQPSVEMLGGIYFTKNQARSGKSLEEIEIEEKVVSAQQVEERQNALQDYFSVQVKHLWNQGSITWNPAKATSIIMKAIPNNYDLHNFNGEGRGKQKKQMKMLLPLLIGLKLKLSALAAIGYMGIALIAKKAILAGLISLLISGFIAAKQLIETYHHKQEEHLNAYHAAWADPVYGQQYEPVDLVAAHSNQQAAYVDTTHSHAIGTAAGKASLRR